MAVQQNYHRPVPTRPVLDVLVRERQFESSSDTIYILGAENTIEYCNPAWDAFALNNNGSKALRQHVRGVDVLRVCGDALRPFYSDLFEICRSHQKRTSLGYHCSSPELLRVYQMVVEPVGERIIVTNHLLREAPHPGPIVRFRADHLRNGVVTLCANCRRTRNWHDDSWEWIPEMLESAANERITHGICESCTEFYFGREFLHSSQRLQSRE